MTRAFKNLLNEAESVANKSKAAFAAANKESMFVSKFSKLGKLRSLWAGIGLMAYDTVNLAVNVDPWAGVRAGLRYGLSTTAGFFVGLTISGCSFGGASIVGIAAGGE